jgi:hypothetical protein
VTGTVFYIHDVADEVIVDGVTCIGATGTGSRFSGGGAIRINDADAVTVSHCVFDDNHVDEFYAAGVSGYRAAVDVLDCTFTNNTGTEGVGVKAHFGSLTVERCHFENNEGVHQGGAVATYMANVRIADSVFLNNAVVEGDGRPFGGAVDCHESSGLTEIVNCVFAGNTAADRGGAMWLYQLGQLNIYNCTFYNNDSPVDGAVYIADCDNATVANSIFAGHTAPVIHAVHSSAVAFSYNLFDGNSGGIYYVTEAPALPDVATFNNEVSLAQDNLAGAAAFVDPATGDFRLTAASDAIDAGMGGANAPATDIVGAARGVNGTFEARGDGSDYDIGAYEYSELPSFVVETEGEGSVSPPEGAYAYALGEVVQLVATPAEGWTFERWEGDVDSGDNPYSLVIGGNTTVRAVFVEVPQAPEFGCAPPAAGITPPGTGPGTLAMLALPVVTLAALRGRRRTA